MPAAELLFKGAAKGAVNMKEEWRIISGTDGMYEVSNTGKIRSNNYLNTGRVQELKLSHDGWGYLRVRIIRNGKRRTQKVHRLVAEAFIPNPDNLPQVNHLDGVHDNNNADNLEWCTASRNVKHAYDSGLKEKNREYARKRGKEELLPILLDRIDKMKMPIIATNIETGEVIHFESQMSAARGLGVSQSQIRKVLLGEKDSAHGYVFVKEGDADA